MHLVHLCQSQILFQTIANKERLRFCGLSRKKIYYYRPSPVWDFAKEKLQTIDTILERKIQMPVK